MDEFKAPMIWQPIETAPKNKGPILAFDPEGIEIPDNVWTWPEGSVLYVMPVVWHEPNDRTHEEAGWYAPFRYVVPGYPSDPGSDYYEVEVHATHWMPLPEPPK